jgi:hypothetical protein
MVPMILQLTVLPACRQAFRDIYGLSAHLARGILVRRACRGLATRQPRVGHDHAGYK